MNEFGEVKKHWDDFGGKPYQDFWNSYAHKRLSEKEEGFIKSFIPSGDIRAFDFGSGSGRILNFLLEGTSNGAEIYGVDASQSMVKYCRERFSNEKKIKEVNVIESVESLNRYGGGFDFITAIRSLKYNKNWEQILANLTKILTAHGLIVFTMPKKYFFSGLFRPADTYIRADIGDIREIAAKNNMEVIEAKGFSRIPEFFYLVDNELFSRLVVFGEEFMRLVFGDRLFSREVLYVLKKK